MDTLFIKAPVQARESKEASGNGEGKDGEGLVKQKDYRREILKLLK